MRVATCQKEEPAIKAAFGATITLALTEQEMLPVTYYADSRRLQGETKSSNTTEENRHK